MALPPLDLAVEITDAGGVRTRWDSGDSIAGNRPQDISFSTKRGDGFAEGSVTLSRRIDRDYVDLHLFDDVAIFGIDGSVAYEGRVAAQPRSFSQAHSISVQLAGWMSHARDQPFTEIYVDRDLSAWQAPSRARQAALVSSNFGIHNSQATRDVSNTFPAVQLQIQGAWVSPYKPVAEAVYDAGGTGGIAYVYYNLDGNVNMSATFEFYIAGGSSDAAPDIVSTDIWAGVAGTNAYYTLAGPRRFVTLQLLYNTTPAGADGADFSLFARNLAVYGTHGLTLVGDADPDGFVASDIIKNIASRWCPKLDTSGVQDTFWPIPHLVFKDPTDPYDAFLAVNAFHLWELGVWENKTLTYGPANRLDYDWEVRLSDLGVDVSLQGDSTEDLANGMIVEFTNIRTGAKDVLNPSNTPDLADTNPDNPVNTHGLNRWTKLSLSAPTTTDSAIQIGRAALTEFNAPKAPGTITVTGHIRDRAGHWQQGWRVRAGDTIAITDHPNDSPRLVTETSWNHESKQLTVTVDSTAKRLDAVLDRIGLALTAGGVG